MNPIDEIFLKYGDTYDPGPPATGRGGLTLKRYQRFCDAMESGRRLTSLDLQALSHAEARAILSWEMFAEPLP